MSEESQKHITISETNCYRYLLGQMAEDEVFEFDEICFSDDSYTEELEAIREEIIDRYLKKELNAKDKIDFENYFLASPYHQKKFEFSKNLLENFSEERSWLTAFAEFVNIKAIANFFSLANFSKTSLAAASLLVLLVGFGLVALWISTSKEIVYVPNNQTNLNKNENENVIIQPTNEPYSAINSNKNINSISNVNKNNANQTINSEPQNKKPETNKEVTDSAPVFITFLPIPALRATGDEKPLILGKQVSGVRLEIAAPMDKTKKYFVFIRTADNTAVWKSPLLNVGNKSQKLFLTIPAKVFSNNDYKLEIFESDNLEESVDAYSFRVEKKN